MRKLCLFITLILVVSEAISQPAKRATIPEYVSKYKDDAIKDMMKMGVPASITLSQGILESESGNSKLARSANNHFGIKCHKDWTGDTFHQDDDARDECFRKYKTVLESFDDHGRFLRERVRYAALFDLEVSDYKGWAHGLKKAGYATNPRYAELLIKIIEEYDLHQYDKGGKKIPITATAPTVPLASAKTVKPKSTSAKKPSRTTKKAEPKTKAPTRVNSNSVPLVVAAQNDSWLSIAIANDMRLWQILKYNDAEQDDLLNTGDIVYLKPKRGRPQQEFHIAAEGESLWQISQKYGVKMKTLIKLNQMNESVSVINGQKIKLR